MAKVERDEDGRYKTRLSITDPVTGKRVQKRVSGRTKRELDAEIARVTHEVNRGQWIEPDKTPLAVWMDRWHATYRASGASRFQRAQAIRNHIAGDEIGEIPIGRLRYAHVQDWIDRLAASGLSRSAIVPSLAALSMALDQARRRQLIASNPCDDLSLPPASPRRWHVLSLEESQRLIDDTRDEPDHALWVIAITVGLRRGELIGLRWSDIDLSTGMLRVERTLTRDAEGQWLIGETAKSATSRRPVRLPVIALDALRAHRTRWLERRLAAADIWQGDAVFDAMLGQHARDGNSLQRRWTRLKATLGLPKTMRFHDLRHTAATLALYAGVPITSVSQMLGHASPVVTMRTYSHVIQEMMDQATSKIDALYQGQRDASVPKEG